MANLANERIGLINKNTYGSMMEIVEYNRSGDIWVKFLENGNLIHTAWKNFNKGTVRNPYDKSIYGVGYLGDGEYKISEKGKLTDQYNSWHNIFIRCFSEKVKEKYPTYKDCTVCEEWHNFQNFAAWYDQNYYEVEGEKMHLDKDILIKGNKMYSPSTCIFVPMRINKLFIKHDSARGEYPIGVFLHKRDKKYYALCDKNNGESRHIGTYDTQEEAFEAYKICKENVIKEIAEEYKDKIPIKLYNALINYIVEITD